MINSLIDGKELKVKCGNLDKFGRILCDVFVTNDQGAEVHVNQTMIDSGLVFRYDGSTKMTIDQ